ncbi:serine hydrolase domain-containing protein [Phenylobacterium sp.]|uniref:serine hydrolase domain-containing protein n=1 Tax=Phenylobacterium sp. TaxID=1871053 RepID=UPI00394AF2D6
MRSEIAAVVTALAVLFSGARAWGQEAELAPPPAAPEAAPTRSAPPGVNLPDAPVPYTQIRPKRPAPKTRALAAMAPAATTGEAAAGPGVAGAPTLVPGLPTLAAGARLATGQPIPEPELEAFVDGWVRDAMAREHIAGAAVSVVQGGQVVLNKGYGFAGLNPRRPVDPDRTLFRIGSISKTFTWILLMNEVEKGRIRLDRPINDYLPEKVRIRAQGYQRPVLVRNLMDHSPGFDDPAMGQLFERDPGRIRPLDLYLRQERPRRVRGAGVASSYSNYGAALAGFAVATLNRKPFEQLVEEEITRPLGMDRTTFREPRPDRAGLPAPMAEALRPDAASGYWWTGPGFAVRPYEYIGQIAPAGAASSTAGDMARYMLMLLGNGTWNGATVFGPGAARAFRTPLQATPPGINGWAHGFIVYDLPDGRRGYGHDGATLSFHSSMVVIPELDLGIFITTNSDEGHKLTRGFAGHLVRQFYAPPMAFPRPGSAELLTQRDAFEGYYLTSRRAHGGLEGFVGLLIGGTRVGVTPEGRLTTVGGEGIRSWVPEGPLAEGRFVSATGDERLAFQMQDGHAASFRTAYNTERVERAPFWRDPNILLLTAGLTALAALATLVGIFFRNRREFRENQIQARAAIAQNIQAGLWLAALGLAGAWGVRARDEAAVFFDWPGPLLITASTCGLVAAALTAVTVAALPAIWQGGRRVDSWGGLRKIAFTITVLIYAAFSVILALWGALEPWSG